MLSKICPALLSGFLFASPSFANEHLALESCDDEGTCRAAYEYLSNQDIDPFLFLGKVVDRAHPRWRDYRKALRRYPDVRDCLVKSERDADTPNLFLLNWDSVAWSSELDVCVFRIMRSLPSLSHMYAWLEYHGFKVIERRNIYGDGYTPKYELQQTALFEGGWSREQLKEKQSLWLENLLGTEISRGFSVNVALSNTDVVVGVHTGTRTK